MSENLPFKLIGDHWTVTAFKLFAFTDDIDTPVQKNEYHLHRAQLGQKIEGMFDRNDADTGILGDDPLGGELRAVRVHLSNDIIPQKMIELQI